METILTWSNRQQHTDMYRLLSMDERKRLWRGETFTFTTR